MYSDNQLCMILIKFEFSSQISPKLASIKFNKNWATGRRVVPCRRPDGQGNLMAQLTVALHSCFLHAPDKTQCKESWEWIYVKLCKSSYFQNFVWL